MSQHPLTPAQAERLAFLAEECAEVIQAVAKIQRHGFDSINPFQPEKGDNRILLEIELGDIQAAINLLHAAGDIEKSKVKAHTVFKTSKMARWFHHQGDILK